jgi:AraC family cel operon transcriptional repressor
MIRPEDRHGIVPAPGEAIRLTNIAFPRPILEALGQNYFLRKPVFFWSRQFVPFAGEVGPGRLRRLNGWADELAQSSRHRLPIDRFLLNLFAELSSDRDQAMPGDAPGWLVRACGKIRAPEQFAQGVGGFLRLCGRSREHVARTVRRYLRTTPTGYVNQVRMNHARRQLEMGDREIIEIALECGIENLSHFYALFRRETGTTPRAYRLDHRRSL